MNSRFDKTGAVKFLDEDEQQEDSINVTQDSTVTSIELTNLNKATHQQGNAKINHDKQLYPYCIVWTALPGITTCMPLIGHTGIAGSDGRIHDFAGSYTIGVDDFAFGRVQKYIPLDFRTVGSMAFDRGIQRADRSYANQAHNIVSHVAAALNAMKYQGKEDWNMLSVFWLTVFKGRFVSGMSCFRLYMSILIFMSLMIAFCVLIK